ncbi:uncharacterized protein LOC126379745 [Pectinophora gossypiella]|uniref:uncharacterized protein LOC126379745 n=1 Tax=Pectinophora gossypiella TaxID=13191 RepID=UPI00214F4DF4|nr:uncharacterized protein LOC126379745 [Pectinophora gossypiella]
MEGQEKRLYGGLTVYREQGAYLRRLEQFEKAKVAYDEAYKTYPEDIRLLIGRSRVCADAVQPQQAYADAELALKLEPRNMNARYMQANAMYTMCDFERSVAMAYRGSWLRRQPPYFMESINQGLETIQDCVGKNSGHVMHDFLPLIKRNEQSHVDDHEPEKVLRMSRIPHPVRRAKLTQMETRKHLTLSRVLAMKYLGPMASDKFFLQSLIEDSRLKSANSKGSEELLSLAKEALRSLTERQDMLRSQRPYYTIKLAEKSESKHETKYKQQLLIRERQINTHTAERLIGQIDKSLRDRHLKDMVAKAERMQLFLDSKTPRTLPGIDTFIDRLYRALGEGFFAQHRLSYKLSEQGNRRRVNFLMGLPTERPTSYDSIIASYPYKFMDSEVVLERVKAALDICENSTMKCYLMYEMARLLTSQKNYALGKFYAKRCQREAQNIGSVIWWLNACFVLIGGDMQQGNSNEVRVMAEEAFEWSKKLPEAQQVQAFLAKCAEMASETVPVDETKAIIQREKKILKVLQTDLRVDAQVLFKRISTVPHGRRFSVLPRNPDQEVKTSERRTRRQRGLSIIPGMEKGLPRPPKSHVLGFQTFDI